MLHTPPQTLQTVLRKLLEQPCQHVADVCFEYPQGKIWAHRAIVLARAPAAFCNKYLSRLVLDATSCRAGVTVYSPPIVPYGIMEQLLRFWYTAEFSVPAPCSGAADPNSSSRKTPSSPYLSSLSFTSTQSTLSSSLATDQLDLMERSEVIKAIQQQEQLLHVPLLALTPDDPVERLVADVRAMFEQRQGADVVVHIAGPDTASFPVHRCILAAQSSYFYAMFCKDFSEATSPAVHLPGDIFSPAAFEQVILAYYYHIDPAPPSHQHQHQHQRSLAHKKHILRLLNDAFRGADYMSPTETVCTAILDAMAAVFRGQYKCTCADCAALLPFMWWFADRYKAQHKPCAALRASLVTLYTDQPAATAVLWPAPAFAVLLDRAPALVSELEAHVDINKQTAVQWLEHLHALRIRTSASHPVVPVVHRLLDRAIRMISDDFCFYCFEYPILLSCVDKVVAAGGGQRRLFRQQQQQQPASFLEFLLTRVVQQGITDANAGEIYQGIVRDLVGRLGAADEQPALIDARNECTAYLARRWRQVKAQGGFRKLDKDIVRKLSEDIDVPYRSLAEPLDSSRIKRWLSRGAHSDIQTWRRSSLSFLGLSSSIRSHETLPTMATGNNTNTPTTSDLHNSNLTLDLEGAATLSSPRPPPTPALPESPSSTVDALLPPEPIVTAAADECDTRTATPASKATNSSTPKRESRIRFELPEIPPRSPLPPPIHTSIVSRCAPDTHAGSPIAVNKLRRRRNNIRRRASAAAAAASPSLSNSQKETYASPIVKLGRWWWHHSVRLLFGCGRWLDDMEDVHQEVPEKAPKMEPVLGAKVELLRRPLPMRGTIRYIGPVHFAKSIHVGVELEDRLGSNDGSIEGHRYFHTNTQRGTFCKIDDFKIISVPPPSS